MTTPQITAEQFLTMPEPLDRRIELVGGIVVDKQADGMQRALIKGQLAMAMDDFARSNRLGLMCIGLGHVLHRNPDTVRLIDISFITRSRIDQVGITDDF